MCKCSLSITFAINFLMLKYFYRHSATIMYYPTGKLQIQCGINALRRDGLRVEWSTAGLRRVPDGAVPAGGRQPAAGDAQQAQTGC